ncbi:hypothetical protein DVH24_034556 [Malus domestica]|uniref:Uncharacterized protein n=1 Tax=Malus domestica TaxID=3750 RepID=A0A498IWU8_MALDO|nr:hypothetical protein DVH24_034556 [Malus domestica]
MRKQSSSPSRKAFSLAGRPRWKKTPNHRSRCQKGTGFMGRWRADAAHTGLSDAACRRGRWD